MRRRATVLVAAAVAGLAVTAASSAVARPATAEPRADTVAGSYEVYDVRTLGQRNLIAGTGAAIDGVEHAVVEITATGAEVRKLRALGFTVQPAPSATPAGGVSTFDFPSRDAAYHNYAET